eukprot:TRINITY_DN442_c0_g1_i11.p1 TRINITY_DN442_c0_g1~~TRINITY_DN442_c0_g1_i11.p1  ORF type:complete len:722 (-),score=141.10 TRINITY_DN442_c0_g1_i11:1158-3323(-)
MSDEEYEEVGSQEEDMDLEDDQNEGQHDNEDLVDGDVEEDDGDENVHAWGKAKRNYYANEKDDESDDDIQQEEEAEAMKLQKLQAEALNEENFFDTLIKPKKDDGQEDNLLDFDDDLLKPSKINLADLEKLHDEAKLQYIQSDSPELTSLLEDYQTSLVELKTKLEPLMKLVKSKKFETSEGISYLEVKFNLLLSYCINITFYLLLKNQGRFIKDHPVIKRLIYLKTLMTKLKPIDKKLEYQISKLLRLASKEQEAEDGKRKTSDPLSFKPNPNAMEAELTTENLEINEDGEVVESQKKKNIYVAPKISSVLDKDDRRAEKRQRLIEKKKREFINSEVYKDLNEEFTDRPTEIRNKTNLNNIYDEEEEKRIRVEEDLFTRLPVTKKDKQRRKQKLAQAHREADELESFKNVQDFLKEKGISREEKKEIERLKMRKTLAETLKRGSGPERNQKTLEQPSDSDEDEFYQQVQNQKQAKTENRLKKKQEQLDEMFDDEEEGNEENLRTINYKILKNKGLIRKRKKEERNSRVKHKKKYEKALIKQKSKGNFVREKQAGYGGEFTGIKAGVIKSTSLKNQGQAAYCVFHSSSLLLKELLDLRKLFCLQDNINDEERLNERRYKCKDYPRVLQYASKYYLNEGASETKKLHLHKKLSTIYTRDMNGNQLETISITTENPLSHSQLKYIQLLPGKHQLRQFLFRIRYEEDQFPSHLRMLGDIYQESR